MEEKFNIAIYSLESISEAIRKRKTGWDIVSIRSSGCPKAYTVFDTCHLNYNSIVCEEFDDIESPDPGFKVVTRPKVMRILKWAKDKDNVVVHCTAGISRSSAIAYLIACSRMHPSEAIKILDPKRHSPNALVVFHGIKVLKDMAVYEHYKKWLRKADEEKCKYI
ncbi:MAG: dual specificity protein phosphatase family protein [Victivallales bacterium]|jgi:predicted protein tyrosine phosphatase